MPYEPWSVFQGLAGLGHEVLWPLCGISIWMWWLILDRLCFFYRHCRKVRSWSHCQSNLLAGIAIGAKWQQELIQIKLRTRQEGRSPQLSALKRRSRQLQHQASKGIQTVLVLAGIAPLLGLLGTVDGLSTAFAALSGPGQQTHFLARGISEALITTQAGLLVSVPGLAFGSLLKRRAEELTRQIRSLTWNLSREALNE